MKNLLLLAALAAIGLSFWKYQQQQLGATGAKTAEATQSAARSKPWSEPDLAKVRAKSAQPAPNQMVAISMMLERWYIDLFSDVNDSIPNDLVPPLTIARERLLEARPLVEPSKQSIYDSAVNLVTRMIAVAEERTKTIETQLATEANPRSSLDSRNTAVASRTFFASAASRKWEETRRQVKPALDQLRAHLRESERNWNQQIAPEAQVDSYGLGSLIVPVVASTQSSSIEKDEYGKNRPWRRAFYDRYRTAYKHRY